MTHTLKRLGVKAVVALGLGLGAWMSSEGQSLRWLGTLGGRVSGAFDVSADGSVVVGYSNRPDGRNRAFRWTAAGGMQNLGLSEAVGVSADGSVVVGNYTPTPYDRLTFIWTVQGGRQELPLSEVYDVSADGSVVVGHHQHRAARWTASGGLSVIEGDVVTAVTPDGATMVGRSGHRACRWRPWREFLDSVQGYGRMNYAWAVSADGWVVAGSVSNPYATPPYIPVYWTDAGVEVLPHYSGYRAMTRGVSADGRVIVGYAETPDAGWHAIRWIHTLTGYEMEDLNHVYAHLLTNGSVLRYAYSISPDGRYIVGQGYNAAMGRTEAFLLDTGFPARGDTNRDGHVDDADLLAVLFAFGARGYTNEDINWDGSIDDADLLEVLFSFGSGG